MYYDREGQMISVWDWAQLHTDHEYIRIAEETIGVYWISTVWIGIHLALLPGPPRIFETMVFAQGVPAGDLGMTLRYATAEDAMKGHDEVVTLVRATTQFELCGLTLQEETGK